MTMRYNDDNKICERKWYVDIQHIQDHILEALKGATG